MAAVTSVHEQLDEKVVKLRQVGDQLRNGDFIKPALVLGEDQKTWTGKIQIAFCGWLNDLNGWMKIRLAGGIHAVADKMAAQSAALLNAEKQIQAGVMPAPIPPPARIGTVPGRPPEYNLPLSGGGMSAMDPVPMKELVKALGNAKGQIFEASQRVLDAVTPPVAPPVPAMPGTTPPRPAKHIPDDAADAAGSPGAFQALLTCLEAAIFDVLDRARKLDGSDPLPAAPAIDVSGIAASGAAAVESATTAQDQATEKAPVEGTPKESPAQESAIERTGTPQQITDAQAEADRLADRYQPPEKVLEDPERVKALAEELKAHHGHPGDSAFAAQVVRRFGAKNVIELTRTLQAYEHGYRDVVRFDEASHMRGVKGDGKQHDYYKEVQGLLYSFCATMATASHSLDQKTAEEILETDDPIGLSWLMSNPEAQFSKDFLVKAFDRVAQQIMRDSWDADPMGRARVGSGMGGHFPDPKLGILDAISRNPEAAAEIINRPDFEKELYVPRGMAPAVEVKRILGLLNQGIYPDGGAALGRMLAAAHAGTATRDKSEAKALTWRMIDTAAARKEVEKANLALAEIAKDDTFDEAEAVRARGMLDKSDKHPAREALETIILDSPAQVARFTDDAANGKIDKDILYQTAGAWEIVKQASLAEDASGEQRRDADRTLERAMSAVANGQKLKGAARQGLASLVALRFDELAPVLAAGMAPADGPDWLKVDPKQIAGTLAEISRDQRGRETLMAGLGTWSAQTYAGMADMMTGSNNAEVLTHFRTKLGDMGAAFCHMTTAVKAGGMKDRAEANAVLSRYRTGVGIAFELLDKVPGVAAAKGVAGKVPGGVAGAVEGKIQEALAADLSGVNYSEVVATTKKAAVNTMTQVDCMVTENMMSAIARRPQLMYDLGMKTWDDWPPFLLGDPKPAPGTPVGSLPDDVRAHIKPEFLDDHGGIKLPVPGSPRYQEFQQWYLFDKDRINPLYSEALVMTDTVRLMMNDCMEGIEFEDSM